METMGFIFGMMGFTFGLMGFVMASSALNKAQEIEERLNEKSSPESS